MTITTTAYPANSGLPLVLRRLAPSKSLRDMIRRLGAALDRALETGARSAEIARLAAKSDDELARMGLTREGIFAHVFHDRFCF